MAAPAISDGPPLAYPNFDASQQSVPVGVRDWNVEHQIQSIDPKYFTDYS